MDELQFEGDDALEQMWGEYFLTVAFERRERLF